MAKECEIIIYTKWNNFLKSKKCKSIAEAIRFAKKEELPFRVFINGECVKYGWYQTM